MSVVITLFVVERAKLEAELNQSIADVLWQYVSYGPTDSSLAFCQMEPSTIRYVALPHSSIVRVFPFGNQVDKKRPFYDLGKAEVFADPFLSVSIGSYLRQNDSFDLNSYLNASQLFPSGNWVKQISSGYRRAWIGSFLDFIERHRVLSSSDYDRLTAMFLKVLRGYSSYKELPERKYSLADFDFPVIPQDDIDLWMGVWSAEEIEFMLHLVRELLAHEDKLEFRPLPQIGNLNESVSEWTEWVVNMLKQLVQIDSLGYSQPNLVSFISS